MKRRPVFVCVCALLAVVAAAAACKSGGGGTSTAGSPASGTASAPLTLQEYFQQVQTLDSRASQRFNVIGQPLNTTATSDAQKLSVVRDLVAGLAAIDKDFRDGLQRITPPPEAKAAHQAAIEALTEHINLAETASDPSNNDPLAFLTGPQVRVADASLSKACEDLRRLAAAHGIGVTLSCGQ